MLRKNENRPEQFAGHVQYFVFFNNIMCFIKLSTTTYQDFLATPSALNWLMGSHKNGF